MIICPDCNIEMRCAKTGIIVRDLPTAVEGMVFAGDKFCCTKCKNSVIIANDKGYFPTKLEIVK